MICMLQVPALGVLFNALSQMNGLPWKADGKVSSPRGSFETELEVIELCLTGVKIRTIRALRPHGLWQLSEGTEKAP